MFGITFTPAALIGFATVLAEKAEPVVDDNIDSVRFEARVTG